MTARAPLVVGYPRTGFSLLISVIIEILQSKNLLGGVDNLIRVFCDGAGAQISARIEAVFAERSLSADLLYNDNFKQLTGGPKWPKQDAPDIACFRKYMGVRGLGDFTLITSHPRAVLDYYEVIHSHVAPRSWAAHSGFSNNQKFTSIRHPAGTLTSACFSLNALASEYIQKFVAKEHDNDLLRQKLALYKLTDLNFFEALLGPYKAYLEEYLDVAFQFTKMKWENLITDPGRTIVDIGQAMGLAVTQDDAVSIWKKLDHVNLTGAHKHNFRYGHGVVGGWRLWLTNAHLEMMCDYGLGELARQFGYDLTERLDERNYTSFQRRVAEAIDAGSVIREYEDEDLFGFAFNKSNLNLDRFDFKRYGWRTHTQIERSSCTDDRLVMKVWDVAEEACEIFNQALLLWSNRSDQSDNAEDIAAKMANKAAPLFDNEAVWLSWREQFIRASAGGSAAASDMVPRLLQSVGSINVVQFGGKYYGIPQSLGVIDFYGAGISGMDGVVVDEVLPRLLKTLESSVI